MQREKNLLFIMVAFLCALIATGGVYYYMNNYEERIIKKSGLTSPIIAANIDLKPGTEIKEFMLVEMSWPKNRVQSQHTLKKEEVIGKVVKNEIAKGMPVLKGFLLGKNESLSYYVPENMRAMTIPFGKGGSDSSFVIPGVYVDVLATFNPKGLTPFTKTILQNVKVIAVNGVAEEDYTPQKDVLVTEVTVLVKPTDTETLALAKSQASLQIVLRNRNDDSEVEKRAVDAETVMFGEKETSGGNDNEAALKSLMNKMPVRNKTVTIIRGTDVDDVRFKS